MSHEQEIIKTHIFYLISDLITPFTYTNVLAVPKSIAISLEKILNNLSIIINIPLYPFNC